MITSIPVLLNSRRVVAGSALSVITRERTRRGATWVTDSWPKQGVIGEQDDLPGDADHGLLGGDLGQAVVRDAELGSDADRGEEQLIGAKLAQRLLRRRAAQRVAARRAAARQ